MRLAPRKSVVLSFIGGMVFLFLAEWAAIITYAMLHHKTPQELETQLKPPPLPSTVNADFSLKLKTLEGEPFDFAQLKGKVIFLTFVNPDCSSCQAEMPLIDNLYQKIQNDNAASMQTAFVLACLPGKSKEADFLRSFHLSVPVYIIDGERPVAYAGPTMPMTFIIERDGKIAFRLVGPARWNDEIAVKFLQDLLKK